jgi:hypothetical protein
MSLSVRPRFSLQSWVATSMGDPAQTMQQHGRGLGCSEAFETFEAPLRKDFTSVDLTRKSS